MRFNTYFKSASYLLTLSAFLSLIFTGEVVPPYVIVIVLGLALSLIQGRFDLSLVSKAMVVASVPFLAADFFFLSGDILLAFTHLLILLTVARLLSLRTNSDYSQLYFLTFFGLLASSALSINLSFAFTFSLYLISATWVLILFHIKKEAEGMGEDAQGKGLEGTVTLPFFLGVGGVAVLSLTITLAIFFVLPRMGVGLFYNRPGKVMKTSGFGDKVDFGSIGPVTLDPATVMRVGLPEVKKNLGNIYLRGTVMDFFNGVTWETDRRFKPAERSGFDFLISGSDNTLIRQDIILEPIDSRVIFGMHRISRVSGRFQYLSTDNYGSVYLYSNPSVRFQYTAYSDTRMPNSAELDSDRSPYPAEILDIYTRQPALSKQAKELVSSVTINATGPYQKAVAIENYLKKNFTYTLNPERDESLPPLEDFLFKHKEGYCDHFSTAMAVLLREAGVPTRLVTGYMTSEWNDLGGFYTVRQRNAHSWVEVYFTSHGWVPFDATPSAQSDINLSVGRIERYIGYLRMKWDRYIINFTMQDQENAVKEARRRTEVGRETILDFIKSMRVKINAGKLALPAVISSSAAVLYFIFIRKRRRWISAPTHGKSKGSFFYMEMLRILAGKGIVKPDWMTPREFAGYLARNRGGYREVVELTELYEKVRYGGMNLDQKELGTIKGLLDSIRKR